jgi:hypothetical protein
MRRVEQYNAILSKMPKCDLPVLPVEHRVFYDAKDLVFTKEQNETERSDDKNLSNVLNLL